MDLNVSFHGPAKRASALQFAQALSTYGNVSNLEFVRRRSPGWADRAGQRRREAECVGCALCGRRVGGDSGDVQLAQLVDCWRRGGGPGLTAQCPGVNVSVDLVKKSPIEVDVNVEQFYDIAAICDNKVGCAGGRGLTRRRSRFSLCVTCLRLCPRQRRTCSLCGGVSCDVGRVLSRGPG